MKTIPDSFALSNKSASSPIKISLNPFREIRTFLSMKKVPPVTQFLMLIFFDKSNLSGTNWFPITIIPPYKN
jgi:hypothetical protein